MSNINDLNLGKWKQYKDILTDSLWLFKKRDRSSAHKGDYHGNFIPQIPNQLMRRFTKKGETVLDPFLGSGTTLIEARKLKRNGIGIEISKKVLNISKNRIQKSFKNNNYFYELIHGDSTKSLIRKRVSGALLRNKKENVQLIIMHPPYYDIIKFSKATNDLSNSTDVQDFISRFIRVVDNTIDFLEQKRFLAIVIGDKYEKKEWIPLGFLILEKMREYKNILLKSIIIKNMEGNRAKRNLGNLWRYRALKGNYYIFKHEYVLLFQKL